MFYSSAGNWHQKLAPATGTRKLVSVYGPLVMTFVIWQQSFELRYYQSFLQICTDGALPIQLSVNADNEPHRVDMWSLIESDGGLQSLHDIDDDTLNRMEKSHRLQQCSSRYRPAIGFQQQVCDAMAANQLW